MTREEAIMILENNRPSCGERMIFKESEVYEAINMAIEALRQPEIVLCKDCQYHIPQDGRCRLWCQFVDPLEWCSRRAERKDGEE